MSRSSGEGLRLSGSRNFVSWLQQSGISLAFTTYQIGKLFLIGCREQGRLSIFERSFNRCMGLARDPSSGALWMATLYQLWRFENALQAGQIHQGHDALFIPQLAYTTGDLDIHDVAVDREGVVFANTLFSCLARPSANYSFEPYWTPPFISRLAAEDRCHLNGLATRDGVVTHASCIARTNANEGWREHRLDGGIVCDVTSGEVVCDGLSMPHSPRWHEGRLWLLDSGRGQLGWVDLDAGKFQPVAFCPGYARGLVFHDHFAIVGVSRPRNNASFAGLELDRALSQRNVSARCALLIIDLHSGDIVHELRIEGMVSELFDVCVLPDIQRPMAIGLVSDDIQRAFSLPPTGSVRDQR